MTEDQMREAKVPYFKTIEELTNYIKELINQEHDYGTAAYATSMASVATFNYVASKLEITGFQSGCADLDILKRIRGIETGFRILDYDKLLYPQYCSDEHFPNLESLILENRDALAEFAKRNLKEYPSADPKVVSHWEQLAEGKMPDAVINRDQCPSD